MADIVRFGVFELDTSSGELRRQGRRVHLAAQPSKFLGLLVRHAGEVVSREDLRRHLWGDDTFVDFDRSLNFCVAEVRAALNDSARSPRFIETIPRHGYRFVADVDSVAMTRVLVHEQPRHWTWAAVAALAGALVIQQPLHPAAHSRQTAMPAARAAFDRAMEASTQGVDGQRRSIAALRMAIKIDPLFAEAHYALADIYLDLAARHELALSAAITEGRAAAERAAALEEMPETRQTLGMLRLLGDLDWTGARGEFARAIALAPSWDSGLATYARLLSASGDDAAAIAMIDRAETISPNCDLILFDAGMIYGRAGRYDEALNKFRRAIAFGPPRDRSADDWKRDVHFRMWIIDLVRRDENAVPPQRFDLGPPINRAILHALAGHNDDALEWLARAAALRDPEAFFGLRNPEFLHLRELSRFREIADTLRVPRRVHDASRAVEQIHTGQ